MKKKSRWLVAVGMVLALMLALVPAQVLADPGVPVDPDGPYSVGVGETFTVYIMVGEVTKLDSGQFKLSYDHTVIDTDPMTDVRMGDLLLAGTLPTGSEPDIDTVLVTFNCPGAYPGGGVSGSGCIIEIDFTVVGEECDTSVLDLSSAVAFNGLWNYLSLPIAADWGDSSVEVVPCGPAKQHIVVSGQSLGGGPVLPYAMWNDPLNDWGWAPPGPPPGFVECDEFQPCEWVWIWGWDFDYCKTYTIWIQPYGEGTSVVDGQPLNPADCPPGFPPVDPMDMPVPCPPDWVPGWVEVHIDTDGTFGPVPIWHVDGEYCELWEIVADKTDDLATNPGFYGSNEDGLDAAATDAWGFHIYPEGLTIILLSLGLAAVGGYLVVRRRKGTETDS